MNLPQVKLLYTLDINVGVEGFLDFSKALLLIRPNRQVKPISWFLDKF